MSSWRLQKAFFLEEVDHEDLFTYEELYVPIPHKPNPKIAAAICKFLIKVLKVIWYVWCKVNKGDRGMYDVKVVNVIKVIKIAVLLLLS